jgi:putative Mn2+ efflux pump MntP
MPNDVALLGLLLGLDSLAVGTSLGGLLPERGRRLRLALWFAVCDGLASLIGSTSVVANLGRGLEWSEWLGPAGVAAYGVYVLYLARRYQDVTPQASSAGRLAFCLPLVLSLDNLVAGTPPGSASAAPLVFGLISGAMALCGLSCGAALGARRGVDAWRLSGTFLMVVAVGLRLKDSFLD